MDPSTAPSTSTASPTESPSSPETPSNTVSAVTITWNVPIPLSRVNPSPAMAATCPRSDSWSIPPSPSPSPPPISSTRSAVTVDPSTAPSTSTGSPTESPSRPETPSNTVSVVTITWNVPSQLEISKPSAVKAVIMPWTDSLSCSPRPSSPPCDTPVNAPDRTTVSSSDRHSTTRRSSTGWSSGGSGAPSSPAGSSSLRAANPVASVVTIPASKPSTTTR